MRTLKNNQSVLTRVISWSKWIVVAGVIVAQSMDTASATTKVEKPAVAPTESVEKTGPGCGGSEVRWLACAIYFEARNQSLDGQFFVAQSILNRVNDPRWPNTVEGVVRQGEEKRNRCQYSFMCDGQPERIDDLNAWTVALFVASKAIRGSHKEAHVTCAHSYRADYVTNQKALRWFASLSEDETVGSHIFYCDQTEQS